MARPRLFVSTAGMQREDLGRPEALLQTSSRRLAQGWQGWHGMQLCQARRPAGAASSTPYSAGVVSSAVASRDVVM